MTAIQQWWFSSGIQPKRALYSDAIQADDPLVWWKMDEVSGTTGADSGRLGLPFTINDPDNISFDGAPLWARGKSLVCGGSSYNGAIAAHNAALNFPTSDGLTISCLFNWNGSAIDSNIVGHGQTNSDWANWSLFITPEGIPAIYLSYNNDLPSRIQFTATTAIEANTDYHMVARWTRSTGDVGIWINGVRQVTGTWLHSLWNSTSPVGVGTLPHTTGSNPSNSQFQGRLDEVAIFDKPLSDERITAHYDAWRGVVGATSFALREDDSFELREDGGFCLRE